MNISKVEIRSCCKAGKPFIRLRFIPQQTQWWRRQGKPQSCEDGPNDIQSVKTKKPSPTVTVTSIHSQQTALFNLWRYYQSYLNCLNLVSVAVVVAAVVVV